jgi:TM2 domain-containing membrane protein YozV
VRGRVLGYDHATGAGLISGDDGERYRFGPADVEGGAYAVRPGREVDFLPAGGGAARSVFGIPWAGAAGEKNRFIAALLAFFLGSLGVHKFYLNRNQAGWLMLIFGTVGWIAVIPGLAIAIIAFIEFVLYLIKDDETFFRDYVVGERDWF